MGLLILNTFTGGVWTHILEAHRASLNQALLDGAKIVLTLRYALAAFVFSAKASIDMIKRMVCFVF